MPQNLNRMSFEELVDFGLSESDARIIIEAREENGPLENIGGTSALGLSQDGLVLIRSGVGTDGTLSIEPIPTSFRISVVPLPEMEPSFTGKVTIAYDDVDGNEQRIEETILLTERSVFEAENVSLDRRIAVRVEIGDDYILERLFTEMEVAESKNVGRFVGFVEVRTFPISRPPTHRFQRRGRFIVPTKPQQRFDGYRLAVAPLRSGQVGQALSIVRLASVDQPADDGSNDVRTTAVAIDAAQTQLAQQLAAFALTHSGFQFDGSFEHDDLLDEDSSGYVGWIWLLAGPSTFFGIQEDDSLAVPRNNVTILLPTFEIDVDPAATIPFDVSEAALLDRPSLFGDDPGTNCQPFDNPGRILGERAFFSVLRVTDPELDREPRKPITKANPFPWEDNPTQFQARSVSIGHIIEFRVRYRSNGYSLGDVAHSMTLVPRQTRRITQIDFDRRESARRTEQTSVTESISQTTRRDRSYRDSVQSELAEWSRGSSKSKTTGAAGGFGAAIGPFVFGGGATHGSASSSSQQSGARAVAASEQQNLRDAIRQYADSVRSLESTTVTEVAQEETVTGVSEVVRNVNHCHALSVIYYQILRHLRVDTEVGGVRECVFVPLSIEPFDDARIAQHRTSLQAAVTRRDHLDALRYLDDIQSQFADSEIADGPRSAQPLTTLRGSLSIHLGITRPTEGDIADEVEEGAKKEISETKRFKELVKKYASIARFLGRSPTQLVHELLATDERSRDSFFQRSVAPHIARVFIDRMRLGKLNGTVVETFEADEVDFTLASSYRFGRTLRVDFTVRVDGQLTRSDLTTLVVLAPDGGEFVLPERSFANLTGGSIIYRTRDFSRTVRTSGSFHDDLVEPETGVPTQAGGSLPLPLSSVEMVDTRRRLEEAYEALQAELNSNLFRYHKAIWAAMDRDALYSLLDGFTVSDIDDRSLASVVEREPIGIVGNTMVFRAAASALVDRRFESAEELVEFYRGNLMPSDPLRVSLPTSGLYARAHMDSCNACEEHEGSTDWVLDEVDPALADLPTSLFDSRRAEPSGLQPSALPDTLINLQNAPAAPAPTGLQGVLNAATTSDAFRDMAGLAGTQANAAAAMQAAAGLASSFGQQAVNLEKARLGVKDAKKKLDTIKKAETSGLIDKAEAKKQVEKVLSEQNTAPETPPLTKDESIQTALRNAASNGQAIERSRQSKDGTESIKIGEKGPLMASLPGAEPLRRICGFFGPGASVDETGLRNRIQAETLGEHANWASTTGSRLEEDEVTKFGNLVAYSLSRFSDIPPETLLGLSVNAIDPTIAYGHLTSVAATTSQVNAAVTAAGAALLVGVPVGDATANLNTIIENSLREAREYRLNNTAWSAAFICHCVRKAAIGLSIEAMSGSSHVGSNELLIPTGRHATYVIGAYNRRYGPGQQTGTYHAFKINEHEPQVGDIIVQDRHNNVVGFHDIPATLAGGRNLHADIIVEADPVGDFVIAAGGNVHHSVRRRRYPLDASRRLVVDRTQLYTQEEDGGNLPAISAPNPAIVGLLALSTGRIFTLLRPVEACAVIPGQQHHGGVIT